MSKSDFGWLHEETSQSLSPVAVPHGIGLVSEDILQLIKCQCDTKDSCGTMRCGCNKTRLGCTVFCVCNGALPVETNSQLQETIRIYLTSLKCLRIGCIPNNNQYICQHLLYAGQTHW